MNTSSNNVRAGLRRTHGALGCALLVTGTSLAAPAGNAPPAPSSAPFVFVSNLQDAKPGLRVVTVVGEDDAKSATSHVEAHLVRDHNGRRVEVKIRDGRVNAWIDGQEVAGDRIARDNDRVVILDDAGNEVETIWLAPDHTMHWKPQMLEAAAPPTVMMGIHLGTPSAALERHLKLAPGQSTMIEALYEGLPAHQAGLGEFDIITKVDGRSPADPKSLRETLAAKRAGDTVRLDVIHEGQPRVVTVTLMTFDQAAMAKARIIGTAPTQQALRFFGNMRDGMNVPGLDIDLQMRDLDHFIIDDERRLFELFPGGEAPNLFRRRGVQEPTVHEEHNIDVRLEALERMLEELLKERRKDE